MTANPTDLLNLQAPHAELELREKMSKTPLGEKAVEAAFARFAEMATTQRLIHMAELAVWLDGTFPEEVLEVESVRDEPVADVVDIVTHAHLSEPIVQPAVQDVEPEPAVEEVADTAANHNAAFEDKPAPAALQHYLHGFMNEDDDTVYELKVRMSDRESIKKALWDMNEPPDARQKPAILNMLFDALFDETDKETVNAAYGELTGKSVGPTTVGQRYGYFQQRARRQMIMRGTGETAGQVLRAEVLKGRKEAVVIEPVHPDEEGGVNTTSLALPTEAVPAPAAEAPAPERQSLPTIEELLPLVADEYTAESFNRLLREDTYTDDMNAGRQMLYDLVAEYLPTVEVARALFDNEFDKDTYNVLRRVSRFIGFSQGRVSQTLASDLKYKGRDVKEEDVRTYIAHMLNVAHEQEKMVKQKARPATTSAPEQVAAPAAPEVPKKFPSLWLAVHRKAELSQSDYPEAVDHMLVEAKEAGQLKLSEIYFIKDRLFEGNRDRFFLHDIENIATLRKLAGMLQTVERRGHSRLQSEGRFGEQAVEFFREFTYYHEKMGSHPLNEIVDKANRNLRGGVKIRQDTIVHKIVGVMEVVLKETREG